MQKRYGGIWPYIAGAAAARTGDEMSGPALLLAGLATTGSPATASALLAAVTAAAALGGPVFGVLLDRSPRPGRLLTATLAGYAAALGAILATLGRTPIAITLLIALTAGLAGPALTGGWTSQLPRVVAPADLPRATTYDAMTFNLAALAGPALAGIVTTLAGARAAMTTAIVLICLALSAARALPPARAQVPARTSVAARPQVLRRRRLTPPPAGTSPTTGVQAPRNHAAPPPTPAPPTNRSQEPREPSEPSKPSAAANGLPTAASHNAPPERPERPKRPKPPKHPSTPSIGADLVAGFRAIVGSPSLARATAASMLSCVGQGILLAAGPLLGERAFGSAAHGPTLLSLLAASALTTNAFLARRPHPLRPETVIRYSTLILAGALLLAATAHPIPLIAAMLLAGMAEGPQLTALFTIRHREAPEALRSRIFTTGASLKITTFALGAALTGPLLTHSLTTALATAALFQVLATLSLTGGRPMPPADGRTNAGSTEHPKPEPESEPEPEQHPGSRQESRSPER
ncbi:MFS transporter [Embleya sp. MST-111070]|uniref:MFS transporter n=1 Tax=Embleya sp. MST-111070 TaxID=3398231 RepID=UPI003F733CC8